VSERVTPRKLEARGSGAATRNRVDLTSAFDKTEIDQIISIDPPRKVSRPSQHMNLVSHGIDRPDDHDLPWVDVLSSSGWIARWIVMEHPSSRLSRSIPVTFEVLCSDYVALVIDSNQASRQRQTYYRGATSNLIAKPGLRMGHVQAQK